MKSFDIPTFYRSPIIGPIKEARKITDPRKKDFTPTVLDFGTVKFVIARHFGFCYGVENAIEISYRAIEENPGKRIFLLSQMIHNQEVNADLESHGLRFIQDTLGNQLIPWDEITSKDIVIVPAFGTTLEIEAVLKEKGIETTTYDTTCPFVTRVWKRADKLSEQDYSLIIHGKHRHEETRATFSHSSEKAPTLVIKDMEEAKVLGAIMKGEKPLEEFYTYFEDRYSEDFDPEKHLARFGVINQTTMLATETQVITDYLKGVAQCKFGEENIRDHVADTRDTLCYATNDNQESAYGLLKHSADIAVVVGGYNSSNTSHLVELCEEKLSTFFINSEKEIEGAQSVHHFDLQKKERVHSSSFLPKTNGVPDIILTSGASCPDAIVDRVMMRILEFYPGHRDPAEVVEEITRASEDS
ncbi:MAG: 4-hydroxy-3-methylbut-2-enyl diphosphate reductase [Flavobacteriales bacterium]|nr:4-hydroxy-3-methylbut-2-enyl diphosphate reductase [Flavobacteriales bacterium]